MPFLLVKDGSLPSTEFSFVLYLATDYFSDISDKPIRWSLTKWQPIKSELCYNNHKTNVPKQYRTQIVLSDSDFPPFF